MPILIRAIAALALAAAVAGCAPSTALDDGAPAREASGSAGGSVPEVGPCNGVVPQLCPFDYEPS